MRCACHNCGAYMVHSESMALGCVCPDCGRRCADCLGTGTLLSKDDFKKLAQDPAFARDFGANAFYIAPAGDELEDASGTGYELDGAMSGPEEDIYGD